jgi:hypothetical protein
MSLHCPCFRDDKVGPLCYMCKTITQVLRCPTTVRSSLNNREANRETSGTSLRPRFLLLSPWLSKSGLVWLGVAKLRHAGLRTGEVISRGCRFAPSTLNGQGYALMALSLWHCRSSKVSQQLIRRDQGMTQAHRSCSGKANRCKFLLLLW